MTHHAGDHPPVVVITGGSAGVGRAAARKFGAEGCKVAVLARGEEGLRATAQDIEEAGGEALTLSVDMADAAAVEKAADTIEQRLGPVEVWINAVFASILSPFVEIEPAEYTRVTDVCYHGYVHGTRIALERMLPRDRGVIVQVGSALAYRGIPAQSAYCGAKHAVRGFTDSVRAELGYARSNVRVTTVHLPAVNTPQFSWVRSRLRRRARPVPPVFQPEVAAQAVVFAARHPKRREYWVGGSTVLTILGNSFAPRLLDLYLARTGYEAQQTPVLDEESGEGNLFASAAEESDPGARGRFDSESRDTSAQLWLSRHRGAIAGGAAAAGAAALAGMKLWRNPRSGRRRLERSRR